MEVNCLASGGNSALLDQPKGNSNYTSNHIWKWASKNKQELNFSAPDVEFLFLSPFQVLKERYFKKFEIYTGARLMFCYSVAKVSSSYPLGQVPSPALTNP